MTIFFDDDDFEPLGPGRDDAEPGSPAGRNDTGGADLDRIDNDDYLLEAGFAAEAHLGQLVDGDDDGDGNPWTPAGLEDRFYEDMREHLDGAPDPGTREALQGDLDRIWERTRPEIVGREHARRLRKRATVGEGTLARYRELAAANPALAPLVLQEADDTLGRLQGLGTARDAVDERRRMFRTEVRDAVLNQASETDPRGALEAFKSGGYAELFDGDDEDGRKAWEGHLTQAAVTRDDDDAWERERGELENRQMKGLAAVMFRAEREQAIRSGDVSGAKITQAVKSGLIGREEGEQLRQAALARKDELRETSQRMTALMDRARADEEFGPDEETAGMVDDWYDTIARPAWDLLPDDQRRAQEESLVRRTGILPAARAVELRRGLNSDDPEAVIASAEQLAALRDASPDMEAALNPEAFPPAEVERGLRIAAGIKAGHPPEKVLEAVGENAVVAEHEQQLAQAIPLPGTVPVPGQSGGGAHEPPKHIKLPELRLDPSGLPEGPLKWAIELYQLQQRTQQDRTEITDPLPGTPGFSGEPKAGLEQSTELPPTPDLSDGREEYPVHEPDTDDNIRVSPDQREELPQQIILNIENRNWKKAKQGKDRYIKWNDGREYVQLEDGSINFGRIPEKEAEVAGIAALPIRLAKGSHDQKGMHNHGDVHVEASHGQDIRRITDTSGNQIFDDVAEFVAYVAENYNEIRELNRGATLVVRNPVRAGNKDSHPSVMVHLVLDSSGDYYTVATASPLKQQTLKKQRLLFSR